MTLKRSPRALQDGLDLLLARAARHEAREIRRLSGRHVGLARAGEQRGEQQRERKQPMLHEGRARRHDELQGRWRRTQWFASGRVRERTLGERV
jgi:hypothetical protein